MPRLSPVDLESLRQSVLPEYAGLPADDLEQIVDSAISDLPADAAEGFLKSLGSVGKTVGSTLQSAAPGIAQGAASGAAVGGPWGALIGAGAGLASGVLKSQGKPATPATPAAPASVPPAAPGTAGASAPQALPTGRGAAATLLSLFQNPAVQRALMSQALGASGKQQVPTPSGTDLPRAAINALLMQLLANASEELPESESTSEQSYLLDEAGEYLIDPASPEQQAALVLARLQPARGEAFDSESDEFAESVEWIGEASADWESAEWLEAEDSAEMVRFY